MAMDKDKMSLKMKITDLLAALAQTMKLLPRLPKIPLPTLYLQVSPTSAPVAGGPENIYQFILALIPNPVAIIMGFIPQIPSVTISVGAPPVIVNGKCTTCPTPPPSQNKTMPPIDFFSVLLTAYKETLNYKQAVFTSKPPPTSTSTTTTAKPTIPPNPSVGPAGYGWGQPSPAQLQPGPPYIETTYVGSPGPIPFVPFPAQQWPLQQGWQGPRNDNSTTVSNNALPYDPYWNAVWQYVNQQNATVVQQQPPAPQVYNPQQYYGPNGFQSIPQQQSQQGIRTTSNGLPWQDQVYYSAAMSAAIPYNLGSAESNNALSSSGQDANSVSPGSGSNQSPTQTPYYMVNYKTKKIKRVRKIPKSMLKTLQEINYNQQQPGDAVPASNSLLPNEENNVNNNANYNINNNYYNTYSDQIQTQDINDNNGLYLTNTAAADFNSNQPPMSYSPNNANNNDYQMAGTTIGETVTTNPNNSDNNDIIQDEILDNNVDDVKEGINS